MKTTVYVIAIATFIFAFSGLAFSDTVESAGSAKYTADMSDKKGFLGCVKEDAGMLWQKLSAKRVIPDAVRTGMIARDLSGMIPPASKPVMDMPRMAGTLQPETCYAPPEAREKK